MLITIEDNSIKLKHTRYILVYNTIMSQTEKYQASFNDDITQDGIWTRMTFLDLINHYKQ